MADSLQNIGVTHLMFYLGVCVFYLILLFNSNDNPAIRQYNFMIFFTSTFIVQLGLNFADINNPSICKAGSNANKFTTVLFHTIVPWVFVLALGHLLINIFPGWLRIFSNTLGMSWAYQKYGHLLDNKQSTVTSENKEKGSEYVNLLNKILLDKKKLLNEIDIIGMDDEKLHNFYINQLSQISSTIFSKEGQMNESDIQFFKKIENPTTKTTTFEVIKDITKSEHDILCLLKYKNTIGYGIWYILLGVISVMISTNSVIASNCGTD